MNTMNRCHHPIRRTMAVSIIGTLALGCGAISAAAEELGVPTATIRYRDLNLNTSQGARVLYQRIASASYAVCQSFDRDRYDNADPLALQECRKKVIADAVTKIGKPALSAIANVSTAKPMPARTVIAKNHR